MRPQRFLSLLPPAIDSHRETQPPGSAESAAHCYLGVDGGGSKTTALLVDADGKQLGRGLAGGSNSLRIGLDEATRNLERAVNIALREAGVSIPQISYAYCGVAGADHPEHRQRVVDSLRLFFPYGNFIVDSDARIALTGAVGLAVGVVIIAGTGSVAYGRSATGREARAGGWGPILGDEGSGYAIARAGLAAIARAHDGRGPATKLTDLLCRESTLCDPDDLPTVIYAPNTRSDDIARYGKLVVEAARQRDEVAINILQSAGEELGTCVLAVAQTLSLFDKPFPVAYVGGAFHAGDLLLEPMEMTITAKAPWAAVTLPAHEPVEGAVMLAIEAAAQPRQSRRAL